MSRLPARRFLAVMHEGKPLVQAKVAFANYLTQHFGDGEEVDVTVTKHRREATDAQRGYYRAVILPIFADYMGEPDEDAVHEALAFKFLRLPDHPVTGTPRRQSTSPKVFSDQEMSEYLERLIAWGTVDCGLLFPEPEKNPAKRTKRGEAA